MPSQPVTPGPVPYEVAMHALLSEALRKVVEQNEGWPAGEKVEEGDVADYLAFSGVDKVVWDLARQLVQSGVQLPGAAEVVSGQ